MRASPAAVSPPKTNKIDIVVGRRGCGKTTLAKNLIRSARRLIILDPMCEYNIGIRVNNFSQFAATVLRYRFNDDVKITYFPQDELDIHYIFKRICNVIYEFKNVTFVVEELGLYMGATSFPASFKRLVMGSRHQRVNIIGITQRATDIPRNLRSQADSVATFQQTEPGDIEYISKFMNAEKIKLISNLKVGHYLEWRPDGSTTPKIVPQ